MSAPDYAAALVGWRCWLVVLVDGGLRLCSPVYPTIWPQRQETRARCRNQESWRVRPSPAEHQAPEERCRCGIYASDSLRTAARFVASVNVTEIDYPIEQLVFGRVSLWGQVIECEQGWRAGCAYPAALYVPALPDSDPPTPSPAGSHANSLVVRLRGSHSTRHHSWPGRWWPERTPHARQVTRALRGYGVPVELIPCETVQQAAEQLAA